MVERLICNQDVRGSIPRASTKNREVATLELCESLWEQIHTLINFCYPKALLPTVVGFLICSYPQ